MGAHFILPWISIWKLRLSFLFFMHKSLFMSIDFFLFYIPIITSKVLPLICYGSSRYINQLFMTSLILKKRCYQCWLWWQICLLTRSFLLYTKNFMYYLQLFTVSEMWYCKCIQWVIKLAYCFAVSIIYGCLGNSFLLDYCTVVIKIASLIFETQSLILFYIFLFIFCCYAASFTYIFLMWNPYSIIQLISCYNIFRASCSPIAYMIPVYV